MRFKNSPARSTVGLLKNNRMQFADSFDWLIYRPDTYCIVYLQMLNELVVFLSIHDAE